MSVNVKKQMLSDVVVPRSVKESEEAVRCKAIKCVKIIIKDKVGKNICKVRTLLKVLSQMNSAPQNQYNIKGPTNGTAAKIFEKTVKPQ